VVGEELDVRDADRPVGEVAMRGKHVERKPAARTQLGQPCAQPLARDADQRTRLRGGGRAPLLDHVGQLLVVIADVVARGGQLADEADVPRAAAEEVAADDAEALFDAPHPARTRHVGVDVVTHQQDAIAGCRRLRHGALREAEERHRLVAALERGAQQRLELVEALGLQVVGVQAQRDGACRAHAVTSGGASSRFQRT